jgi:hypothetical protein
MHAVIVRAKCLEFGIQTVKTTIDLNLSNSITMVSLIDAGYTQHSLWAVKNIGYGAYYSIIFKNEGPCGYHSHLFGVSYMTYRVLQCTSSLMDLRHCQCQLRLLVTASCMLIVVSVALVIILNILPSIIPCCPPREGPLCQCQITICKLRFVECGDFPYVPCAYLEHQFYVHCVEVYRYSRGYQLWIWARPPTAT